MITTLHEKTSNNLMIYRRIDEKEGEELKKTYNHNLDKREDFKETTEVLYHEIFGDSLGKEGTTSEKPNKLKDFQPKNCEH